MDKPDVIRILNGAESSVLLNKDNSNRICLEDVAYS